MTDLPNGIRQRQRRKGNRTWMEWQVMCGRKVLKRLDSEAKAEAWAVNQHGLHLYEQVRKSSFLGGVSATTDFSWAQGIASIKRADTTP
jgi:hypothetical protein